MDEWCPCNLVPPNLDGQPPGIVPTNCSPSPLIWLNPSATIFIGDLRTSGAGTLFQVTSRKSGLAENQHQTASCLPNCPMSSSSPASPQMVGTIKHTLGILRSEMHSEKCTASSVSVQNWCSQTGQFHQANHLWKNEFKPMSCLNPAKTSRLKMQIEKIAF